MLTSVKMDAKMHNHLTVFLASWLKEFAWFGEPLTKHLEKAELDFFGEPVVLLSNNAVPLTQSNPRPRLASRMYENPFSSAWQCPTAHWGLTGTWLHKETLWEIDGYHWAANNGGGLYVGTLDRNNPSAPRRFDPDKHPQMHDIGVLWYPLNARSRVPELIAAGFAAKDVAYLLATIALIEFGVHESFELYQDAPGSLICDPHQYGPECAPLTLTFAGGYTYTCYPFQG